MAENLIVAEGGKEQKYLALLPQIEALVGGESDPVANMANVAAALKMTFGHLWVGFYVVKGDRLVLAPFQGPIACTRIGYGKGVCGTAWKEARTLVVPDVELFPGHIACSSASRSEIVVPVFRRGEAVGVDGTASDDRFSVVSTAVDGGFEGVKDAAVDGGFEVAKDTAAGTSEVVAVLDIDSDAVGTFDDTDARWLERICRLLTL